MKKNLWIIGQISHNKLWFNPIFYFLYCSCPGAPTDIKCLICLRNLVVCHAVNSLWTITNRDLEVNSTTPFLLLGALKEAVTDSMFSGGERFQSVLGRDFPKNPEASEKVQRNTTANCLVLSVCAHQKCLMMSASVKMILDEYAKYYHDTLISSASVCTGFCLFLRKVLLIPLIFWSYTVVVCTWIIFSVFCKRSRNQVFDSARNWSW